MKKNIKNIVTACLIGVSTINMATAMESRHNQSSEPVKVHVPDVENDFKSGLSGVDDEKRRLKAIEVKDKKDFNEKVAFLERKVKKNPNLRDNKIELVKLYLYGVNSGYLKESDPKLSLKNMERLLLPLAMKDDGDAQILLAVSYLVYENLQESFKWAWMASQNPNSAYPIHAMEIMQLIYIIEQGDVEKYVGDTDKTLLKLRPEYKKEYEEVLKRRAEYKAKREQALKALETQYLENDEDSEESLMENK